MALKKHKININVISEPGAAPSSSSFIVDLKEVGREAEEKLGGLQADEWGALERLQSGEASAAEFWKSAGAAASEEEAAADREDFRARSAGTDSEAVDFVRKDKAEPLFTREKARELMFFPLFRLVFRALKGLGKIIQDDSRQLGEIFGQIRIFRWLGQNLRAGWHRGGDFFKKQIKNLRPHFKKKIIVEKSGAAPEGGHDIAEERSDMMEKQPEISEDQIQDEPEEKDAAPVKLASADYKRLFYKRREFLGDEHLRDLDKKHEIKHGRKKIGWRLFYFILFLIILILPFKIFSYYKLINIDNLKGRILGASQSAVNNLIAASQSAAELNLNSAGQNFSRAGADFMQAQADMKNVDELMFGLAALSKDEKYKLASEAPQILDAGVYGSRLGDDLTLSFDSLLNQNTKDNLGVRLDKFVHYGGLAVGDAHDLNGALDKINLAAIPPDYQDKFLLLKSKAATVEKGLSEFVNLAGGLNNFLGVNQDKRYLLVFQNNNELRASGGFIGSYALVDLRAGRITNLEVPAGGSYDTEAGLSVLVAAPEPLRLVNALWHFWDANWWPDWRLSARNLMWFYEKSAGPSVDGVISFTPEVLEKLLAITGPIDMTADYGVTVTADNFWEVTQSVVEKVGNPDVYASSTLQGAKLIAAVKNNPTLEKNSQKNQPKKIIGDLMNRIMEELPKKLNKDNLGQILKIVDECLSEKHILFYFTDPDLQKKMEDNSWAGAIKGTLGDYLEVVNTNIAGGKSDLKIKQQIAQNIEVRPDNSIVENLTITRTHTGVKGEPFSGVRNVDWLRVYVPEGSQLLSASGFSQPDAGYFKTADHSWQVNDLVAQTEGRDKTDAASGVKIYNESNKTVFADWTMVDPGQTAIITFKYKLPFKLAPRAETGTFIDKLNEFFNPQSPAWYSYSLLVQKQPGAQSSDYYSTLKLASSPEIIWKYPDNLGIMNSGWNIKDQLDQDNYYMILFKNK